MTRRGVLKGSVLTAGALVAGPLLAACNAAVSATPAASASTSSAPSTGSPSPTSAPSATSSAPKPAQIFVRNSGGAYQDATDKAIWQPFTAQTGIKVVPVNMDTSQLLAQVKANQVQVDVTDDSEAALLGMQQAGALLNLDYNAIGKSFSRSDVAKDVVQDYMIGKCYWASVLAYRTDVFASGAAPKTWADFWDVTTFPGARALQDDTADVPELEFAEIASGTAADPSVLYPINVTDTLKKMTDIRPKILKFWSGGAESASLLDRKEVVLMSIWNGRAQALIDSGRPVAISWAGARRQVNYWAVPKGAPNPDAAMQYIDFAMRPEIQAAFSSAISYAPTNSKAAPLLSADTAAKLGSNADQFASGFNMSIPWWVQNNDSVIKQWNAWSVAG